MNIVTLTTDMGTRDHYIASLKGKLLQVNPDLRIIDISHEVTPFDSREAAYLLKSCFRDFPSGTIHLIGVDSEPVLNFRGADGCFPSILEIEGHYFVCNDNGFFGTLLGTSRYDKFWRITNLFEEGNPFQFPAKNLLTPIVKRLLNGEDPNTFAEKSETFRMAFDHVAVTEINLIKGHVVHLDNYGNVITNIERQLFESVGKGAPFVIYFKNRNYFIDEISNSYNQVPEGEKVAIFNDAGFLEIAINRGAKNSTGGAQQLFGLNNGDIVRIEFTPAGSHERLDSLF